MKQLFLVPWVEIMDLTAIERIRTVAFRVAAVNEKRAKLVPLAPRMQEGAHWASCFTLGEWIELHARHFQIVRLDGTGSGHMLIERQEDPPTPQLPLFEG